MDREPITLLVGPEAARTFREASPQNRLKVETLCDLWLRRLAAGDFDDLEEAKREFLAALADVQNQCAANGLTPEILEAILNER
jgi:DNA-binding GntR family transcriptional regulator